MSMEDESETKCVLILPPHPGLAHSKVTSTCLKQSLVSPTEANVSMGDFQMAELDYVPLMLVTTRLLFL